MSDSSNSSTHDTLSQLVRESQKLTARVLEMLLYHQAKGTQQPVYESSLHISGIDDSGYSMTVRIQDLSVEPLPVPDYDDDRLLVSKEVYAAVEAILGPSAMSEIYRCPA